MFSIWSNLSFSMFDSGQVSDKVEELKETFLLPLNQYYKINQGPRKDLPKLNKNEIELVKKISSFLNLNEESCAKNYLLYLDSSFNQFHISNDLLEKLHVDELFSAHFLQFVNFYYRERYSFLNIIKMIVNSIAENSYLKSSDKGNEMSNMTILMDLFCKDDLETIYRSNLSDYGSACKEIKSFFSTNFDFTNCRYACLSSL
ncbi:hypothetical protein BpHYR1_041553 [Brachionus plicatilis]|uniref:Uncharacterized protein n=1 Tax=Brachionus plicatilis TaxID=10195 RepID=A0A3M7SRW8_BRAPC|nr:hypothetical protein BpHYR1_041553 [Brachionus plicatilis]